MEITTKSSFFFSFFLHTWMYLLMTPALIMLVIPGLRSYNGVEMYYLKGVIGLPIVISFHDRWYYIVFCCFFKWAHWWCHRHWLDWFRFQNFQSPDSDEYYYFFFFLLFLHENTFCVYLLEVPHWGTSNEYPQHMFCREIKKKKHL